MADHLAKRGFERPVLVESSGGAFEIRMGEHLLFSKLRAGRFPDHSEVLDLIKKAAGA